MEQDGGPCQKYGAVEELEELPSSPGAAMPTLHHQPTQVSLFPCPKK